MVAEIIVVGDLNGNLLRMCRDLLKPNIATATLPILSRSPLRSPAIISSATIGHYTIPATTYNQVRP